MTMLLSLLQITFVILILVFISTRKASAHLIWSSDLLLEINFTFFAFILNFSKKDKKRSNGKRTDGGSKKGRHTVILKTLEYGFSRSCLEVSALRLPNELVNTPLMKGLAYIPAAAVLIYLSKIAREIRYSDAPLDRGILVDLTAHAPLFHLVCTLVFYYIECLKSKSKARARR